MNSYKNNSDYQLTKEKETASAMADGSLLFLSRRQPSAVVQRVQNKGNYL
ncbi:MAG: hypothetical protein MR912_06700 [Prevotella sp.]|nr:hypothetical protein [Prevotella sp.]